MSHRDIAAFLTRRFHGFNRCTGDHLRILRAAIQHVETSDSCNAQRGSHAYPYTRQHRFIHGSLLDTICNRSREGANQIADEKCENSLQIKGIQRIPSGSLRFQQKSPEAPSERASGSRQRLVQFQARANDAVDAPDQHHQAGLEVTMQGNLSHLVRRRPRRHKAAFRTGAGGAVADGENIRIAGSLQRRLDHQLIDTVGFEAADLFMKSGALIPPPRPLDPPQYIRHL